MSLGRTDGTPEPSTLQSGMSFVVETVAKFVHSPAHYLFYGSLTALLIGLYFGREFPLIFYALVTFIGILKILEVYKERLETAFLETQTPDTK